MWRDSMEDVNAYLIHGDLADWVCERKGSVVIDTRRRECDAMWEERA